MANFLIIVDSNEKRRSDFVNTIEPLLSPVEGLHTTKCSWGDSCVVWAGSEKAPVSQSVSEHGVAVVWGDAIAPSGTLDANQLRQLWSNRPERMPDALDGFHAFVFYDKETGIIVGADLLGLYPIYYIENKEFILIGSSPELFRYHPSFQARLSPEGLVGILLTMHSFDGRTLLRDVKRLSAGHVLRWRKGEPPKEILQYSLPVSERFFDLPFSAHVKLLHESLEHAVSRHVTSSQTHGLLLSGGMDSRMLGGYLKKQNVDVRTLTWGVPTDIEMRCAIPVAKALKFKSFATDQPYSQYARYAELQAKWEHVANGFNSIANWDAHALLRKLVPRIFTGYVMDSIVGGSHISWAYSPTTGEMSFETFFERINSCGITTHILRKLLKQEIFDGMLEETIDRIRQVYESYGELEAQRAWCFDLHHRQRFHVGATAWRLSFGAWPVQPAVSKALLELAGGVPASTLADRRAQTELLRQYFPRLAALPLDRNSYYTEPLSPRLRYLVFQYFRRRLGALPGLSAWSQKRNLERRYYYRVYDLNGPGWIGVRRQAEQCFPLVQDLLNIDVAKTLLPPPETPIYLRDGIIDASGLKSLLGFLFWAKNYLQ